MPTSFKSQPPLILIPGLLCDAALWWHQRTYLENFAAIHVADITAQDGIADMADHVLSNAPDRFLLAGLSMGGYVAQEIMRRAPERVVKLALLNTSARPDTEEQTRRRKGLISLSHRGTFKGVTRRLLQVLVHPDRLADDMLCETVMAMGVRIGPDAYRRQQTAILNRPDSRADLAKITCPTLVVGSVDDAVTPLDCAEEIATGIPNARLAVLEDCGHLSTLEYPQAVTALMRLWIEYDL